MYSSKIISMLLTMLNKCSIGSHQIKNILTPSVIMVLCLISTEKNGNHHSKLNFCHYTSHHRRVTMRTNLIRLCSLKKSSNKISFSVLTLFPGEEASLIFNGGFWWNIPISGHGEQVSLNN